MLLVPHMTTLPSYSSASFGVHWSSPDDSTGLGEGGGEGGGGGNDVDDDATAAATGAACSTGADSLASWRFLYCSVAAAAARCCWSCSVCMTSAMPPSRTVSRMMAHVGGRYQ